MLSLAFMVAMNDRMELNQLLVRVCVVGLLAGMLAACAPAGGSSPRMFFLSQRDAAGNAYMVTEERYLGADAIVAVLKFWRAAKGEHQPVLQLTLDDWCGNPIVWQWVNDGIVVPATPATARQDPENPDKCKAQPARAYVLRGGGSVTLLR